METGLSEIAGVGDGALGSVLKSSSSSICVLCEDAARAEKCRAAFDFGKDVSTDEALAFFHSHRRGLLSERHRRMLERGEDGKIRRSALRRRHFGPGMFPEADDPLYLLGDYVADLGRLMPAWAGDGRQMLSATATEADGDALASLVSLAREDPEGIAIGGAPFHSLVSRRACVSEVNALCAVSAAIVLLVGLWLFRGLSFVLPTFAALACGIVAAAAATFLMYGKPHAMTFLFGTCLIGLGVDYCYHALAEGTRASRKNTVQALFTTCLAFAPLLFSRIAVLSQMAVFTCAGLVAVYATILVWFPPKCRPSGARPAADLRIRVPPLVRIAVPLVSCAGLFFARFGNDLADFYSPDPLLAAGEARVAEAMGLKGSKTALVEGSSLEDALQKEEAAGLDGLSRIVPSMKRQEENARLKERLGEKGGEFVRMEDLPGGMGRLARRMVVKTPGGVALVSRVAPSSRTDSPGVRTFSPRDELVAAFDALASEAMRLALASALALAVALVLLFGRSALSRMLPVAGAVAATAGLMGWLGIRLNLFHTLCFFVVAGLGIDYVIFHRGNSPGRVVFGCFLTTLTGLGMLSFTSFGVTRSMGMALSAGVLFSYLLSIPGGGAPACVNGGRGPSRWHEQKEQSAGRLRLAAMWAIYRLLGKNAAKVAFAPVFCFIYPFCGAARQALARFSSVTGLATHPFSHLLGFAFSLIDKVDACTLCRNPPRFTFQGDAGWDSGAFVVASHVGCIEVMPALVAQTGERRMFHAFQQLGHDAQFTSLLMRHMDSRSLSLHAVEDVGVETAVEMKAAIERGESVLMAGDRPPASGAATLACRFFGRECRWPKGVFRFAALMKCPVFALVCVKTGWNSYEIRSKRLDEKDLLGGYVAFLEGEARRHPEQWYHFYDFFAA